MTSYIKGTVNRLSQNTFFEKNSALDEMTKMIMN